MTKQKLQKNNKEIERLAKFFSFVYESNYLSKKRMMWFSFLRGIAQGVGGFIGATIGVSIMLWLASIFLDFPILGSILKALEDFIKSN